MIKVEFSLKTIVIKRKQSAGLPNCFLLSCNHLQKLNLDHNQIRYFPLEIIDCTQLRELYLNFNVIEEIPSSISKLTLLTKFEIESNSLESLPVASVFFLNLFFFYLYFTRISTSI